MPLQFLSSRISVAMLATLALALPGCSDCGTSGYRVSRIHFDASVPPAARSATLGNNALRVSVAAMQSPRDTYATYSTLFSEVGRLVDREVTFVQRSTYRETNDLLASGQLDVAFICTGGYLELRKSAPDSIEVLAVPQIHGKTSYQSLVIVPADSTARVLDDLAGRTFAFTDVLSLSGYAYPTSFLAGRGTDPGRFFSSTVLTRGHDRSITAVSKHLVDGAAVDSLIYEYLGERDPGLLTSTRVLHRSPPLGMMPIVASTRVPAELRQRLLRVLLSLHERPEAKELLLNLKIDRFVVPESGIYDAAAALRSTP